MTKGEEIRNPNSVWNKAKDNEPLFILRAQDKTAVSTILFWLGNNISNISIQKYREVLGIIDRFMSWKGFKKNPD